MVMSSAGARAIRHQRKGVMTSPVTRKRGVVVRSVVMNSSAPPAFATVTCKASRADNPKVQASVYAWVTSAAETGIRAALEKNRFEKIAGNKAALKVFQNGQCA
jgi:hypothetical protein